MPAVARTMLLAIMINNDNGPVAALERPLHLLLLQLPSTWKVLTTLKRVELVIPRYLPNLPCGEVDAQRREGVGITAVQNKR